MRWPDTSVGGTSTTADVYDSIPPMSACNQPPACFLLFVCFIPSSPRLESHYFKSLSLFAADVQTSASVTFYSAEINMSASVGFGVLCGGDIKKQMEL